MPAHLAIPEFLSHLQVDPRGYPIPFFVAIVNGKPDFRLLDAKKQQYCIEQHKCAVCGKKLIKGVYYFISGPKGAQNKISSDPAMHKECAEYSLQACPHLYFEKAERRENNLPEYSKYMAGKLGGVVMDLDKPKAVFCVMANKFKAVKNPVTNTLLIKYNAVRISGYVYKDGVLTEVH